MTSPPYWGLRDYGLPDAIWGGDPSHQHLWNGADCECDAWRGQLGLEPTVEMYVEHLVDVMRAVRRVMRADGTCWLNLGDMYGSSAPKKGKRRGTAFRPKDLVLMPARAAIALQEDGWFVRSKIVWAKANPQPESVDDRPSKGHEELLLLTKSEQYYYDADATRQVTLSQVGRTRNDHVGGASWEEREQHSKGGKIVAGGSHNLRDVWMFASQPYPASHFAVFPDELAISPIRAGTSAKGCCAACGAPFVRITERTPMVLRRSTRTHGRGQTRASGTMIAPPKSETKGWARTCQHESAGVSPSIVLDPFAGTGTTGVVARRYLRRAIMIDVDATYLRDRLITRAEYDTAKAVTEEEWFRL